MRGVDFVFHLAAVASVSKSVMDPVETHEVNVHGTLNVLLAAREARVKRVIFASSAAIYGSISSHIKVENLGFMPLSPYAASKLAGEGYMQAFYHSYGLETLCLRYFNVYGPRQDPNSDYASVIPSFALALLRGDRPTIYGDGTQSRDFCYVKDVAKANILATRAASACGQPINIGSGRAITVNDLASEMRQILVQSAEPLYTETRPGDVLHSLASIDRASEELGYSPEISLRIGLEETLKWYEQHLIINRDLTNIV
jgi:UDP-glucose 4-epimerase